MNKPPQRPKSNAARNVPPPRASKVLTIVIAGGLAVAAIVGYKFLRPAQPSSPTQSGVSSPDTIPTPVIPSHAEAAPTEASSVPTARTEVVAPTVSSVSSTAAPSAPPIDPRQSLATLASLDVSKPPSAEQKQQWKDAIQNLVKQGAASVPVIQDFLSKNQDLSFAGIGGANQLGYPTLRTGLIDALAQIGGPDGMAALKQTLQTTPYPTDLAALSKALDAQAPGQFDSDILGAARQQLSVAVQGQLGTLDVGPLFQILTDAAAKGVDVSADIQQYESRWPYYASITLAKLPDGSGVPNLIQMAQSSAGSTLNPAAESLAELAPQYPQAANTLIDMAKANQLPDSVVVRLAQFLGGREYQIGQETTQPLMGMQGFHVSDGNQDFASTEIANLSAEQIAQRLAIVNQLLAAIPADSRGSRAALQQQQVILNARLGKLSK